MSVFMFVYVSVRCVSFVGFPDKLGGTVWGERGEKGDERSVGVPVSASVRVVGVCECLLCDSGACVPVGQLGKSAEIALRTCSRHPPTHKHLKRIRVRYAHAQSDLNGEYMRYDDDA